jgi:uncharacterized membrane protein
MDPFWSNIYDDCKDRRYGSLFFATLLGVSGIMALGGMIEVTTTNTSDFQSFLISILAVIIIVLLVFIYILCRRLRTPKTEGRNYSTLSRDELIKARSKLVKGKNPIRFRQVQRPARRAPARVPDTDLKY